MTDPDPSPSPRVSRRRGRRLAATLTALAALLVGGYAAACALAPLPAPALAVSGAAEQRIDADPAAVQAAVDAQPRPTAAGWLDGEEIWANSEEPAPIASISKLVTVLVALEAAPLEAGSEGPVHVWTAEDRERTEEYLAEDGVAYPIPVGTEVTTRQMLMLALIPSANDFAAAYAASVFGDTASFVAAVDDWAQRHGLDSLTLFEPTGMDERNAASPADVLRVARLALGDETVAEIVSMPEADLPWGIGTVESTNPLFGALPDIRGLKTGRTSIAGYNLASAQAGEASGRALVKLAVVLGRDTANARFADSVAVLAALDAAPQAIDVVAAGEEIGVATTVDGLRVPLVAAGAAEAVLIPGESATRTATLAELRIGDAGQRAGTVAVAAPSGDGDVPVVTTAEIAEPGFWWRVAHPARLFGG
ncbi:hypothetical protein MUN78_00815 [Leucobacter allii]|uniref:Peptidase S11 D-alanyl-D-alanine carboxypeptidase A N-terminal domain-containing protein n=1 Tax=Leucobacter allii TaxID=2932247 RepID=A0ABY4FMC4_9MICO|nr:serine hydrolase [Leucobacter allii]UOQ57418.1 hypothetical protein MUN78_00815 [Leucobacter allii]